MLISTSLNVNNRWQCWSNYGVTLREEAEDVGWLMDMKCILKLINFDKKNPCIGIADLVKTVITVNKPWVYGYDVETKGQSSQWNRLKSKKAHQVWPNVNVLVSFSFIARNSSGKQWMLFLAYAPLEAILKILHKNFYITVIHLFTHRRPDLATCDFFL